jgi:hypothetical protein
VAVLTEIWGLKKEQKNCQQMIFLKSSVKKRIAVAQRVAVAGWQWYQSTGEIKAVILVVVRGIGWQY